MRIIHSRQSSTVSKVRLSLASFLLIVAVRRCADVGAPAMLEVWIEDAEGAQSLWQVTQSKLGQGGFAEVYEARGPGGRNAVAKVSDASLESAERGLFDGEVAALQTAQGHPNVVGYVGEGRVGNKHILLLEHVRGGDLMDRVLQQSALVEHEAARAMSQLLAALDHIQSRGVCHGCAVHLRPPAPDRPCASPCAPPPPSASAAP